MGALSNINRISYKDSDVISLLKLYQYRGKDFYYESVMQSDITSIKKKNLITDTYYLMKYLKIDINENRFKLLINRNSKAKNKDEQLIKNIYDVLQISYAKGREFILNANEAIDLTNKLFKDIKKMPLRSELKDVQENLITFQKSVSIRPRLAELYKEYTDLLTSEEYEIINLIVNFYVDFINLQPFNEANDLIGLIIVHNLLFRERFSINYYVSFFEFIYNNIEEINDIVLKATYNLDSSYIHTEALTKLIIKNLISNYKKLDHFISNYELDAKINKCDNIENTIFKLPQTFTKEDIRAFNPLVSDSTINRTLKRLKEEGKISPLGTGRSATWIRNVVEEDHFELNGQINIYDMGVLKDEN